jgi:hypothetical protein
MDPAQIVIGAFASRVAARVVNSILGPENKKVTPEKLQDVYYELKGESGETLAVVSEPQRRDIEQFLESREVSALLQSWCVLSVSGRSYEGEAEILHEISLCFGDLAEAWCDENKHDWGSLSDELWHLVTGYVEACLPHAQEIANATIKGSELFSRFSTGAELLRGRSQPAPRFIRDLVEIVGSPERMVAVRRTVADLREAGKERFGELSLTHTPDEYRFEVDKLYVNRTLKLRATDQKFDADSFLSTVNGISRTVVIGDPGAGKSTLVQHTAYRVIQRQNVTVTPILVQSRDYAAAGRGTSLTSYICGAFSADNSLHVHESVLVDVLTLGCAYVIFDGVDEIIDQAARRQYIRQIESFAQRFPLVPILATARRVGYSRASFRDETFKVLELDEFTDDQFTEYVDKWFSITGRDVAERNAFIHECRTVEDIRCNPLMLSLLCALYRARGHIPRNRRQVYRDCSDLLFQRWDAMRHIEQPFDHRQYGQKLMQELARFFYRSQSAQAGVEENQLVRIIGIFFRDTASIDPPEDEQRARQFLDFCADRAWLLSSKGYNARGIRLFAFTHRTFMEYLAAEALVRNATSVDQISTEIVKAFDADPSSVLPDVMVQAADDKYERGAEQVLKDLFSRGGGASGKGDKFLSLCLRIVNSSPMSRAISDSLPRRLVSYWKSIGNANVSYESSLSFFELYRDPRSRMLRAADVSRGMGDEMPPASVMSHPSLEFRDHILERWSRLGFLGLIPYFEQEWSEGIDLLLGHAAVDLAELTPVAEPQLDRVLIDYLIYTGKIAEEYYSESRFVSPRLYVNAYSWHVAGSVLRSTMDVVNNSFENVSPQAGEIVEWYYLQRCIKGAKGSIGAFAADTLSVVLSEEVRNWPSHSMETLRRQTGDNAYFSGFLLWLCFVLYETNAPSLHPFHEFVDGVIGIDALVDVFATRESHMKLSRVRGGNLLRVKELRALLGVFGAWALDWVNGMNLIEEISPTESR